MTNIKATNIELTNEIREYIDKRLATAERFMKEGMADKVYVEVGKTTNHHKQGDIYRAEFNVAFNGESFNAISEQEDLNAAIDDAHDELVRQIKDGKDYKTSVFRRGARSVKKMLKGMSKRNPFTSKVEK
jgi:ribosomal subunit interface protein